MHSSGLLKPRIIDVQSLSPVHAKVVMEPFERGYGHTLGNALHQKRLGFHPYAMEIAGLVRAGCLSREEGVRKLAYLVEEALRLGLSGVGLKDRMGIGYLPFASPGTWSGLVQS